MSLNRSTWILCPMSLLILVLCCAWGYASEPVRQPAWTLLHSENAARPVSQQISGNAQNPVESIQLELPARSALVLGTHIGYPCLIDDLTVTLPLRADCTGIVLAAQIVLPHSIHPKTGRPISFLVPGTSYTGTGTWERLGFVDRTGKPDLIRRVDEIARLLRLELNMQLNMKDRYVRQLVLFTEPENVNLPARKNIQIAAPELAGRVTLREELFRYCEAPDAQQRICRFDPINYTGFKLQTSSQCNFVQGYAAQSDFGYTEWKPTVEAFDSAPLVAQHQPAYANQATRQRALFAESADPKQTEMRVALTNHQNAVQSEISPASLMRLRISDKVLSVDDVPIGVRAIEYQGEPLAFLRQLEFNTVWVKGKPSPALLQEAKMAGVWLICAPPDSSELTSASTFSPSSRSSSFSGAPVISSDYDNVLAWNLGNDCANPNHDADSQKTILLQNADRIRNRPILCTARSGVREYSRIVNILMMERKPLLSSLDMNDLRTWQIGYPTLARPDTPFWSTIQTDPDPLMVNQWILFGGNYQDICPIIHEQIKMQVYQALAIGTHGLLFTSHSPLTNDDPATEYRRLSLELINWELQLIENWFAAGQERTELVRASDGSKISVAVLSAGRSRLLIPIWQDEESQLALGAAVAGPLKFVVAGIPETYRPYHLVPGRLFPLKAPRVAGGMELELEEANLNTLIYFGEEGEVAAGIEKRAKMIGPKAAYLACRLAEMQLASTEQVLANLKQAQLAGAIPIHPKDMLPLISMPEQESNLKTIKEQIDFAKELVAQTPPAYATAYLNVEKATRGLRLISREMLREATRHDLNPCMTPVSVSFATLPYYLNAYQRTAGAGLGPNRLPCGDMENVNLWQQAQWGSDLHRIDSIAAPILRISSQAKHTGHHGLQMIVRPTSPEDVPVQLETSPVWVTTPPIDVRMGEMISVSGWIRIPEKLTSTVDGLMIFDSLGGESLALRFTETKGQWRQFAFYRFAPADSRYFVAFTMHGVGEVHLDDIVIANVRFDMPPPTNPQPEQNQSVPYWRRLNPFNYLPPLPTWPDRQKQ